MKKTFYLLLLVPNIVLGQLTMYFDGYSLSSNVSAHERPLAYNYAYHGMNINYGLMQYTYSSSKVELVMGIHTGDYVEKNYNNQPDLFKYIGNLYCVLKLSSHYSFNVGITTNTFTGYGGIKSFNNPTLTPGLGDEGSPYYMSGSWIKYSKGNIEANIGVVEGFQVILDYNKSKCLTGDFIYTYKKNLKLSCGFLTGNEQFDSLQAKIRFLATPNLKYENEKYKIWLSGSIGAEQEKKWYGGQIIVARKYRSWALNSRFEYFRDKFGVAVAPELDVWNGSMGVDYFIASTAQMRVELRKFWGDQYSYWMWVVSIQVSV